MGLFIKKVVDKSFESVLDSISPCLSKEGYHLMTDIGAQNEYRARNDDKFRRFVVFENRVNRRVNQPGTPTGDPALRMASNLTLREMDNGATEIVGFDPALPLNVNEDDQEVGHRTARQLGRRIEHAVHAVAVKDVHQ